MGGIISLVIFIGMIVFIIKCLNLLRDVGRAMLGKPSVAMEKAQKFFQEVSKDNCILRADFTKFYKLINKEYKDPDKALAFLKRVVAKLQLRVIDLPDNYLLAAGSTKEQVNTKIDSTFRDFNFKHYIDSGKLTDANRTMYSNIIYMTLFALSDISTVDQAKAYVDSRFSTHLSEYKKGN